MENMPQEESVQQENGVAQASMPVRVANPYILPASILIAALIVSGSIIYMVNGGGGGGGAKNQTVLENPVVPDAAQLTTGEEFKGKADAPVLVIEYGDYQCPFCGEYFKNVEPSIMSKYVDTGKVKFAFRHLAFLGPESLAAAEAAECSKEQGKFWEYHDALYRTEVADFAASGKENNGNLTRALFMSLAKNVGLNTTEFGKCIDSNKYADAIQQANSAASTAGVYSTPTTFVNGVKVVALDANDNPIPDPRSGDVQSVGANPQPILDAIEKALKGR